MSQNFFILNIQPLFEKPIETIIEFLTQRGLIKSYHQCSKCLQLCKKVIYKRNIDKKAFRCMNNLCKDYKKYISLRVDSFFSNFTVDLRIILKIIWKWFKNELQIDVIKEVEIKEDTINKIYTKLRLYCEIFYNANPVLLGGYGVECQVDESNFRLKPKYHRGRYPEREIWVLGIADTSYVPSKVFLQVVADRSSKTLIPIINQVCRPGSVIVTDEWRSYRAINQNIYNTFTVNHSLNFINPETGRHTQNIESFWAKAKGMIKKWKGLNGNIVKKCCFEWMYKNNEVKDNFEKILCLIKL